MNDVSEVLLAIDEDHVLIVGEYTAPSGPYADDYFLVLILDSGEDFAISMEECDAVISSLQSKLGIIIELGLCNRSEVASRIIFPLILLDHPLFEFKEKPIKAISDGLKIIRNFGITEIERVFTIEVQNYIQGWSEHL